MWEVWNFEATFPTSRACNADCLHDSPFQLYQAHEFLVPVSLQANANPGLKWAHLRAPVKWVWLELSVEMDSLWIHAVCIIEILSMHMCIKGRSGTKLTLHQTLPTAWSFCHVFYSANTHKIGTPIYNDQDSMCYETLRNLAIVTQQHFSCVCSFSRAEGLLPMSQEKATS